ncbi:MAG: WYL domain-containing transcriptional regulator [Lachnospiraceae bacterium]|nr:WYL domain-containing transcriptional regulator [Candidatus Colinaster scatohippi]
MARGANQKLKLFRLAEIMQSKTDEEHYLTMPEILEELEKYEISAERKSIYNDLRELEELGIDIESEQRGKLTYYHVVGRKFELPELKLLVDAIQSSKFITVKKTNDLIKKLETFCSEYEARQLQRQVFVQDRIKTMNESIYYSVDAIHSALSDNKKIRFQYFKWNIQKNPELRHNGEFYVVSPWALNWDDENYYLVAYDSAAGIIKHYRVDKMLKIEMVDEQREGKEFFESFNAADYAKRNFAMFGGEEESVSIELENDLCGVFIDRFGKEINFVPLDANHCTLRLKVALSRHFLGWIIALGPGVRITGSKAVLDAIKQEIERLSEQYNN